MFYAVIGFIVLWLFISKIVFQVVLGVYERRYGGIFLQSRLKSYGQWAIVTGATRGCGLEFSRQLARLGMNLVLIARNEKLLKVLAEDLELNHKIKTTCIVADFNDASKNNFDKVFKGLEGKDIGVLVNNAGLMYNYPEYFHSISQELLLNMISVNVIWCQMLAQHVLERYLLPKNKGLIVFMSSLVDETQTPLMTAYGASKAYITYLAKCLSTEYSNSGVKFQVLAPSYMATDMTKYNEMLNTPSLMSPSAETYVRSALRTFGMALRTSGYFPHDFQVISFGNISVEKTCLVVQYILSSGDKTTWEILSHPPYSSGISPTNYHLFLSMSNFRRDKRYLNDSCLKSDIEKICWSRYYRSIVRKLQYGFTTIQIEENEGEPSTKKLKLDKQEIESSDSDTQ